PRTISGDSAHVINLNHRFSRFNPNAQPAIDIEELNSGMYALRHLVSALQSTQASADLFINSNNTVFPTTRNTSLKEILKSSIPTTITGTTVKAIEEKTALALIPVTLKGFNELIDTVTEIDLSTLGSISAAKILLTSYSTKTTLTETEQRVVFSSVTTPSVTDLFNHVKKEKTTVIQQGKNELQAKLEASGMSEEEIVKALADYEKTFIETFITENINAQLLIYRTQIGSLVKDMNQALINIKVPLPEITPQNVHTVNGMTMLQTIVESLQEAMVKEPALGGDTEVLQMIRVLAPLLSQTTLSTIDLSKIHSASELPNKSALDRYLNSTDSAIYRDKITGAYQQLVLNLNKARRAVETSRKTLEEKLALFQEAHAMMSSWLNVATKLKLAADGPFGSGLLTSSMELYAALQGLSSIYDNLTTEEQTILNTYTQQYLNTGVVSGGDNVAGWIAKMGAYQILADFCLHNTVTTYGAMRSKLHEEGRKLESKPFFSQVGRGIQNIANEHISTFQNYFFVKATIRYPDLSRFIRNNLTQTVESGLLITSQNILAQYNAAATAHIQQLQQQIANLETQYANLDPENASFTNQRKAAVQKWLDAKSLGSSLVYMILNSQLPKQANFLEPLIKEINFNNLAANALNNLLNITNSFAITSVYYNFSSYLIESKEGENLFSGDYFETLLAMSREREYIARDTERCKRASTLVQNLITKIKNLEGVDTAQRQVMLNATTVYEYSLAITQNQLTMLDSLFLQLTITPELNKGTYDNKKFKIVGFKDWIPTLAALEGFLSNGFPNITPTGGLGPLFSQVQSDQQGYTTQSQTQQLNLQNQMTNIQQEWTLVSTSMQILNQILAKLVREIYPN
ncbi:CT620/CT621 family type III secretion system effector, partial [Chlamydia sp. 17-3921]